jgi:hypothetical protein
MGGDWQTRGYVARTMPREVLNAEMLPEYGKPITKLPAANRQQKTAAVTAMPLIGHFHTRLNPHLEVLTLPVKLVPKVSQR